METSAPSQDVASKVFRAPGLLANLKTPRASCAPSKGEACGVVLGMSKGEATQDEFPSASQPTGLLARLKARPAFLETSGIPETVLAGRRPKGRRAGVQGRETARPGKGRPSASAPVKATSPQAALDLGDGPVKRPRPSRYPVRKGRYQPVPPTIDPVTGQEVYPKPQPAPTPVRRLTRAEREAAAALAELAKAS